jgi:hypothetical protein
MSISQVTTRDTQLEKQRIGKPQLSLTNFSNTLEPAVAAGSVVEVGGSLYTVTVDEAITGWAGIGNDTDCYIKMVPGSPMTVAFVTAAPTWSHAKQGWYNGNDRYVAGLHRGATAAAYEDKWVYQRSQDNNANHRILGDGTGEFDGGVVGDLTGDVTGRHYPHNTLHGAAVTEETIFDTMAPDIPVVGDKIIVNGGFSYSSVGYVLAWAQRTAATTITFYTLRPDTGTVPTYVITEDDATSLYVALAW